MSEAHELLAEALDELKVWLVVAPSEEGAYTWDNRVKMWCRWCKRYDAHSEDCLISRIGRALEHKP